MQIIKLIQNETIKTFKKTSTKIIIILSVLALLGAVGFANLIISLNDFAMGVMNEEWQTEMKEQIADMKKTLESNENHYDAYSNAEMKAEMETYELALKYNINYLYNYSENYWKVVALSEIKEAKLNLNLNSVMKDEEVQKDNEKIINDRIELLEKDNYAGFIGLLKDQAKQKYDNKIIDKESYEEEIYLLNLREKYGIYKEDKLVENWKETVYNDIVSMKECLKTGINRNTGKLLKVEEVEKLRDDIKIAEYRLENDIQVLSNSTSARGIYDSIAPAFSLLMVSLLVIIVAGSTISTEISKGTIKFLLFTPNKRWKILLSKILSTLIILVVLTLILSILSVVIGNIFFEDAGNTYVYVKNGEVNTLSNLVYTILYFLASDIDIIVYMFFGILLSVITRNTALSVGVSIGCYVGSGIVMQLINAYISADWVKFIPFNNMGLQDAIFANNISFSMMQTMNVGNTNVGFSLSVLAVCVILMVVTMFDSFNKRDIV